MTKDRKEYDWLDDPFDEKKKAAQAQDDGKMGSGSKAVIGCGCMLVVFVLIAVAFFVVSGLLGAA